jgi:cobalt-zinc-cadmium efflux system membrane fusion protein
MNSGNAFMAAVACLALLSGCSDPPSKTGEAQHTEEAHHDEHEVAGQVSLSAEAFEAARIATAIVGSQRQVPRIRVTGTLSYDERMMAIATARIGGRITRVIADLGQSVASGEALAWIDSPELGVAQADYLRAKSMAKLRQAEHQRAQLLVEGQAISQGELLRREAEWRAAEADLNTAEQKLLILGYSQENFAALADELVDAGHEYPVRAPLNGSVTERKAVQGRVVTANDELFTVARLDSLWLFLQVFEKDLHAVRTGAAVTLTCESHPDHRFSGTIDFVGQVLDPHSRTIQARAIIANPDGKLKPGMFVYASIETASGAGTPPPVVAIPRPAVTRVGDQDVVFVQESDRTFVLRQVGLGTASQDWVEIYSGLTEGEVIAVEGVFTLKSEVLKGGLEGHDH